MTEFVMTDFDDFMEAYEAFQHEEFAYVMLSHNPGTRHYTLQAITSIPNVSITHWGQLPDVDDAIQELQDFFELHGTPVFMGFLNYPHAPIRDGGLP